MSSREDSIRGSGAVPLALGLGAAAPVAFFLMLFVDHTLNPMSYVMDTSRASKTATLYAGSLTDSCSGVTDVASRSSTSAVKAG
jgi:hypothetical protein